MRRQTFVIQLNVPDDEREWTAESLEEFLRSMSFDVHSVRKGVTEIVR